MSLHARRSDNLAEGLWHSGPSGLKPTGESVWLQLFFNAENSLEHAASIGLTVTLKRAALNVTTTSAVCAAQQLHQ